MRSLIGTDVHFVTAEPRYRPSLQERNPLSVSFSNIFGMGAVIQVLKEATCRRWPLESLRYRGALGLACFLMSTPRKLACPVRALVMSVFGRESSSLRVDKKSCTAIFNSTARLLGPQIPISQSSAYRTYSKRKLRGLGR